MNDSEARVPTWALSVDDTLRTIGSPAGSAGSGSAAALALGLAIECLALHLQLTTRGASVSEAPAGLGRLERHLEEWRAVVRRVSSSDAACVARMIASRARRSGGGDEPRRAAIEEEIGATLEACRGLFELSDTGEAVAAAADQMIVRGVRHARAESVTARALARAVVESVDAMLEANATTLTRRCDELDRPCPEVDALRAVLAGYEPIECSVHDRLEDVATRRAPCRIEYRAGLGGRREVTATIDGLWTRDGAEFAQLSTGHVVRLDRIETLEARSAAGGSA